MCIFTDKINYLRYEGHSRVNNSEIRELLTLKNLQFTVMLKYFIS